MSEVIGAFLRAECGHDSANPARETRDGSFGCLSQLPLVSLLKACSIGLRSGEVFGKIT